VTSNVHIPPELLSEDSKKGSTTDYISSYIFTRDPTKHLVCNQCQELISFIESVQKLINVFSCLNLTIQELRLIGTICKSWRNSANYILSIFREIQYKLPTDDYNKI
jgi:hypothetical protein